MTLEVSKIATRHSQKPEIDTVATLIDLSAHEIQERLVPLVQPSLNVLSRLLEGHLMTEKLS